MNQYYFDGYGFISESEIFHSEIENNLKGVWVNQLIYDEYTKIDKSNFKVGSDDDGFPIWIKLSNSELEEQAIKVATENKTKLIDEANKIIAPLQDASDLDMAIGNEILRLKTWKKYRVLLSRIDTSTAPDVEWPIKP